MTDDARVAAHYERGDLEQAIVEGLRAAGRNVDALEPDDLEPIEEFHIGGRTATADLAAQLSPEPGATLVDVGCGIGGAARFIARTYRCRVVGIDLTAEYVRTAIALSRRAGFGSEVEFHHGSGLRMPFAAGQFDGATMLHVGMNVGDKSALFEEVRRVLRPGALFGVYDVMRIGEGELSFPVPWAASPATSFVENPATYRRLLEAAGFTIEAERDRGAFGLEFFAALRARIAEGGPSPLGIHVVMGATAPAKIGNVLAGLEQGLIAPTEMIARAVA